jgi:hypothetical protein
VAGTSPDTRNGGEHTLEPGAEPSPPPPQPTKFKFAGEEFADQATAEQNFKSLRGQFKPLQQLARSLGGVEKIAPHLTQAAESARGWKAEHDRVKAELDALRSGKSADGQQQSKSPAQDAPAPEADVDWELYAEVKKLATDSGEPWKAEQWLVNQVRVTDRARTEKLINDRLAPLDAERQSQAVVAKTETLIESLAGYTNTDGSSAFPELSDESAAYEVGKLWSSLGLPQESALTPQGAMAAVALYRMAKGSGSPQAKPAPVAPPAVPPAPATPTDTQSAAGVVDGRQTVASVPGNGSAPSAEAARILAGLRQTQVGSRAKLGFDA